MRLMRMDSTCALAALAVSVLLTPWASSAELKSEAAPDKAPLAAQSPASKLPVIESPATKLPAIESPTPKSSTSESLIAKPEAAEPLPPVADDPLDQVVPSSVDEKPLWGLLGGCDTCSSACSCDCQQARYFVRAEHLFLKPRRQLLEYAILDTDTLVNDNGWLPGQPQNLDFERHAGMRLNLGRLVSNDGWLLQFTYTYLHSDDLDQVAATADGELHPTLTHPAGTNAGSSELAGTASSFAKLDYDVLDFELARQLRVGESLQSQFGAGIRLGYIDQEFITRYSGGDFTDDGVVSMPTYFDGYGIRASNETVWDPSRLGLQFFGRVAGSLMTGNFTNYYHELRGTPTVYYLHDKFSKVVPVIELAVGVGTERQIGPWTIGLSFGYEITNWFNLIEQRTFVDDTREALNAKQLSDLGLDGYFIRFSFTR